MKTIILAAVKGAKVRTSRKLQKARKADKSIKTLGAAETKQRVENMCGKGHQRSQEVRKRKYNSNNYNRCDGLNF